MYGTCPGPFPGPFACSCPLFFFSAPAAGDDVDDDKDGRMSGAFCLRSTLAVFSSASAAGDDEDDYDDDDEHAESDDGDDDGRVSGAFCFLIVP